MHLIRIVSGVLYIRDVIPFARMPGAAEFLFALPGPGGEICCTPAFAPRRVSALRPSHPTP